MKAGPQPHGFIIGDHILAFEAMPDLGADEFHQKGVYYALKGFGDRWK